jgi:hypothetical protein
MNKLAKFDQKVRDLEEEAPDQAKALVKKVGLNAALQRATGVKVQHTTATTLQLSAFTTMWRHAMIIATPWHFCNISRRLSQVKDDKKRLEQAMKKKQKSKAKSQVEWKERSSEVHDPSCPMLLASRLLPLASRLLPLASPLLHLASPLLPHASCLLSLAPCPLPDTSCPLPLA